MALIQNKVLEDQKAQQIADQAKSKALLTGNQAVVALNAQDTLLDAQRYNTQLALNQTMAALSQNIYQAHRQQKIKQAISGMVGAVETLRQDITLNNEIANELISVVNNAETNAVNIAAQQASINEQIVQNSVAEIIDIYADDLIDSGNEAVSRDIGREAWNGFTGFVSGALAGAGLGFLTNWGMGKGAVSAAVAGTGLALGAGYAGQSLYNSLSGSDVNMFDSQNQWKTALAAGGVGLMTGVTKKVLNSTSSKAAQNFSRIFSTSLGNFQKVSSIGQGAARLAAQQGAKGAVGKVLMSGGKLLAKVPIFTLATAGIGGIVGAVQAGSVKHYKVDMDKLVAQDTYKAFEKFGLDMSQIESVLNNKTR